MPDKLLSPEYGLSNDRLQECTASPSDVISGKTFYSGDKNKKTGVMPDYGYEPIGKSCTLYNPGDGTRLYIYLPNADTNTQHYGGKIIRSLSIPIDQVYNAIGNRGAWGATINPGESITIPAGYHNGSGKVTANNPASGWRMRYFGGNADNFYHSQLIGAPDGNGTYAWGCSGYVYWGNENTHLAFDFQGQSYPDKTGNNNNFMFYGTNYFDGNTTLGYRLWGGNLNFYYCRVC